MFLFLLTEPSIIVPNKRIPGPDDDDEYDDDRDEPDILITPPNTRTGQSNENVYGKNPDDGNTTHEFPSHVVTITMVLCMLAVVVITIIIILYFWCAHQKKYLYATGQSVLTFSNPNYNASSSDVGTNISQADKRQFLWKRLKYDKSQVCNQH
jgi:hypothetical protein